MPEDEDMQVVSLIKIMKTKGNGKDAMQKPDVFGVECVACCTSSVLLSQCPFHGKHENYQNHELFVCYIK